RPAGRIGVGWERGRPACRGWAARFRESGRDARAPRLGISRGPGETSFPGVIPGGVEPGEGDVGAVAGVRPAGGKGSRGVAAEVGAGSERDVREWEEESRAVVVGS